MVIYCYGYTVNLMLPDWPEIALNVDVISCFLVKNMQSSLQSCSSLHSLYLCQRPTTRNGRLYNILLRKMDTGSNLERCVGLLFLPMYSHHSQIYHYSLFRFFKFVRSCPSKEIVLYLILRLSTGN